MVIIQKSKWNFQRNWSYHFDNINLFCKVQSLTFPCACFFITSPTCFGLKNTFWPWNFLWAMRKKWGFVWYQNLTKLEERFKIVRCSSNSHEGLRLEQCSLGKSEVFATDVTLKTKHMDRKCVSMVWNMTFRIFFTSWYALVAFVFENNL